MSSTYRLYKIMMGLPPKRRRFVERYFQTGKAAESAAYAGFGATSKTAAQRKIACHKAATKLLSESRIQHALEAQAEHKRILDEAAIARAAEKYGASKEDLIILLSRMAHADMDKFTRTDARGRTTIIPQLERQVTGHAISRITLQDNGKKQTQTIALENKLGAAQLLAKLQGFVKDQIETTNVTTQMEVSPEQMSAIMNDPEKAALMRALALQLSLPESNQAQPGEKKNEQDPKSDS